MSLGVDLVEEKMLTTDIWERIYRRDEFERRVLLHDCGQDDAKCPMESRGNHTGPEYWCTGCGFTLDGGEAMAVRLHEVNI